MQKKTGRVIQVGVVISMTLLTSLTEFKLNEFVIKPYNHDSPLFMCSCNLILTNSSS